jgi:hypothetical protein
MDSTVVSYIAIGHRRRRQLLQGWLIVEGDMLTFTTAALAGGLMAVR